VERAFLRPSALGLHGEHETIFPVSFSVLCSLASCIVLCSRSASREGFCLDLVFVSCFIVGLTVFAFAPRQASLLVCRLDVPPHRFGPFPVVLFAVFFF